MKYYLHDTSSFDDEKITLLYLEFGYEGLGLFYTTLEKIGKQEKPINTIALKSQLKVGKRLNKCWKFMEQIELIHSKNGETFNEQLLNISEKYQIKKEKNREKVSQWRERQKDVKDVTSNVPVRNQPKVKESKVKESKEDNSDFDNVNRIELRGEIFEIAREKYPGSKRGHDTEFSNFKKHKDWKECIELLSTSIDNQISYKESKKKDPKAFIPEWKNFKTWINQRDWEVEIGAEPAVQKVKGNTENVNRILEEDYNSDKYRTGKPESLGNLIKNKT